MVVPNSNARRATLNRLAALVAPNSCVVVGQVVSQSGDVVVKFRSSTHFSAQEYAEDFRRLLTANRVTYSPSAQIGRVAVQLHTVST